MARVMEITTPLGKDELLFQDMNGAEELGRLFEYQIGALSLKNDIANSNRLREVAVQGGARAYLVDRAGELKPEWFAGAHRIGVTAGASAPEVLIAEVIASIKSMVAGTVVDAYHEPEGVSFPLPKALA